MKKKEIKNSSIYSYVAGFLFFISAGMFLTYAFNGSPLHPDITGEADFSSLSKQNSTDDVNKHLKKMSADIEMQKMQNELENVRILHSETNSMDGINSSNQKSEPFLELNSDPKLNQMAEDLKTDSSGRRTNDTRDEIYRKEIDLRKTKMEKKAMHKQQAQEFVARARKDGWKVQLDENYRIKSYEPIDPERPSDPNEIDYRGYQIISK